MSSVFFSSIRGHTRLQGDWSSDVCSSDLGRYCDFGVTNLLFGFINCLLIICEIAHGVRVVPHKILPEREILLQLRVLFQRSEERRVGEGCTCEVSLDVV